MAPQPAQAAGAFPRGALAQGSGGHRAPPSKGFQGTRGPGRGELPGDGVTAYSAICISVGTTGLSHQRWNLGGGVPVPAPSGAPLPPWLRAAACPGPASLPSQAWGLVQSVKDRQQPWARRPCCLGRRRLWGVPCPVVPQAGRSCPRGPSPAPRDNSAHSGPWFVNWTLLVGDQLAGCRGAHGDLESPMPAARHLLVPDLFNVDKMKVLRSILGAEISPESWLTMASVPCNLGGWDRGSQRPGGGENSHGNSERSSEVFGL